MNAMHNSFGGGGGGGGYSSPYPGYMPPSALPYYNGYPGELAASQTPSAYYGKSPAAMAGYSTGMAGYSAPNINNSMYYQQYGLGYQYGYGKYGIGAGLTPALGYGSELGGAAGIAPSSLGGLQAPTTDLGLTGSMFSKGSGSSNNKFSLGNSSPHSLAPTHTNSSMSSAIAQTPPSHSPHSLASSLRGHVATPSPPVDPADCKKDLDKMRRCQLCGQVFRLMSECLAHMKAVHEAPMAMYAVPHSSHAGQSIVPPHMAQHSPGRSSSLSNTPDSPLMALERMGWGKEQNVMPSLHSSSPLSQPYGSSMPTQQSMSSHQLNMIPNSHLPDPRYGDPSQQSAKRLNDFYNSCTNQASSHQEHQPVMESQLLHHPSSSSSSSFKSRKSSSYSVSSIIGENSDNRQDRRDMLERGGIGSVDPPQTHSPSLPPSLTPNLPITSTPNLPPNLSPNLPPHIHQSYSSSSHSLGLQPPQLAPNTPSIPHPTNHSTHLHLTPPSLSPSYSSQTSAPSVQSPNNSDSYQTQNLAQKSSNPSHASCNSNANLPVLNSSYNCPGSCSESVSFKNSSQASSVHVAEENQSHGMYNSGASPQNPVIAQSHSYQTQESQIEQNAEQGTNLPLLQAEKITKSSEAVIPSSCENDGTSYEECTMATTNTTTGTTAADTAATAAADTAAAATTSTTVVTVAMTTSNTTHVSQDCLKHVNYEREQFASTEKAAYDSQEELTNNTSKAQGNIPDEIKEPATDVCETFEQNVPGPAKQIHNEESEARNEHSQTSVQTSETFEGSNVDMEKPVSSNFTNSEDRNCEQIQREETGVECSTASEEESTSLLNEHSRSEETSHEVSNEPAVQETVSSTLVSNHVADHLSECESASVVDNETMRSKDVFEDIESSSYDAQQPNTAQAKTESSVYITDNTPENDTLHDDPSLVLNKETLESEAENSDTVMDQSASEECARDEEDDSASKHEVPTSPAEMDCNTNPSDNLAAESESMQEEREVKATSRESTADESVSEELPHPSGAEEDIGDDDEPGDPRHPLRESIASPGPINEQVSWPSTSASLSSCASPLPQVSKCNQPPHTPPLVPLPTNASPHNSEQLGQYSQAYYGQQQKLHAPPNSEYQEKSSVSHPSPPKPHQPGPYRGAWPPGYPSTGTTSGSGASSGHGSYGYHQQQYTSPQNCSGPSMMSPQSVSPSSKGPGGPVYPSHSRYSNQFMPSGFDGRRPMPNSYSSQGHWYPGPGRGDGKSNWPWGSSQSHGYPQPYYYGNSSPGNPPGVSHQHPPSSSVKYPSHQTSPHPPPPSPHPPPPSPHPPPSKPKPTESSLAVVSPPPVTSAPSQEAPKVAANSTKKKDTPKREASPETRKPSSTNEKPRRKRGRPGPKSRVDPKQSQAPQLPQQQPPPPPDNDNSLPEVVMPQQNGSINTVNANVLTPPATASVESSDSSDSDADETPKLAVLKPAKRFRGPDGSFVGPKRVKLAKMVRQRQHTRQKLIEDQIKQSELEEQLTQQWVERASEQEGPLANVLLQSSLLLGDQNVDEPEVMEERIATMTAQLQHSAHSADYDASHSREKTSGSHSALLALKKPGRKNAGHKVLHNYNSVVIRTVKKEKFVPKLRAKDFKWSHYIKSMRYWCKDCGHGFKNQKESQQHGEEQCKANCLYMLECYVSVTDIVQHKLYGNKVEELLEEYQVDGEHKCGRCGTIVLRKADFLVHLDTHKDFMPWECTICGTRFKIRGSLKEHLRYTHMKGRVPCLKCNKVFPTSTLLRQHVKVHTQHYKYSRTGKHREEDLRMAREAIDDPDDSSIPSDQLSHEANEYRNWCKLMELNAMKNIATSDLIDANKEGLDTCAELSGGEENNSGNNTTSNGETPGPSLMS
ncbi:Zinc finger C2H2-type [Trinorchestia longiramus]|nr:Zinc finger C2H2-type [Trinorchestia longiramus]